MKPPVDMSVPSALRILLPGFFVATAAYPLIDAALRMFESSGGTVAIDRTTIWGLAILMFGYLFVITDMTIYMLFEGRRYWPVLLWKWMVAKEEKRLSKLRKTIDKRDDTNAGRRKYLEAAVEIRRFKMNNEGQYVAEFPTRLGNLLAAFEAYPLRVYGMDSVFYWPRLWVGLSKELREEIDAQQAFADSALYTGLALSLCGLACILYGILAALKVEWLAESGGSAFWFGLAILSFAAAFATYRGSLQLHASFGETFKSVFDVYRDKVLFDDVANEVSSIAGGSTGPYLPKRDKYRIVWRYLHNYRIKLKEGTPSLTPQEARRRTTSQP